MSEQAEPNNKTGGQGRATEAGLDSCLGYTRLKLSARRACRFLQSRQGSGRGGPSLKPRNAHDPLILPRTSSNKACSQADTHKTHQDKRAPHVRSG